MQLADFDSVALKKSKRFLGFLKFHRQMAGVVVYAEKAAEPRITRVLVAQLIEKGDCFRRCLEQPKRLRFESKVQFMPGAVRDAADMFDALPEVRSNHSLLFSGMNELFERSGQRANASGDARGQQPSEQIEKEICVSQTLRRGPIRNVYLLLDANAMKPAKRKTVDREYV